MVKYDMSSEGSRGEPLEPGFHLFMIQKVDFVEKSKSSGKPMFVWDLKELETGQQKTCWTTAQKGKRWLMKQMLTACGIEEDGNGVFDFEIDDLNLKKVWGKVEVKDETFVGRDGEERTVPKDRVVQFVSEEKYQEMTERKREKEQGQFEEGVDSDQKIPF